MRKTPDEKDKNQIELRKGRGKREEAREKKNKPNKKLNISELEDGNTFTHSVPCRVRASESITFSTRKVQCTAECNLKGHGIAGTAMLRTD